MMKSSLLFITLILSYNIHCIWDKESKGTGFFSRFQRNRNRIPKGSSKSSFRNFRSKIDNIFKKSEPYSKRSQSIPTSNYMFNTKSFGLKRNNNPEAGPSYRSSNSERSFLQPQRYLNNNNYDYDSYANNNFNSDTKGFFRKKEVPAIERAKYTKRSPHTSLTKLHNPKLSKLAIQVSHLIKSYQSNGKGDLINEIVEILFENLKLCDEVYFQLISQTKENKNALSELRTWEILLVMTTIFPSTKESEPIIKSYFLKQENAVNDKIANIAQLCYIRFSVRCYHGIKKTNLESAKAILYKYNNNICSLYSSIYEQLWFQREKSDSKIPTIIQELVQMLIIRIEFSTPTQISEIFKERDRITIPKEFINELEYGQTNFQLITLREMCYIFSRWINEQIPLIPDELIPSLFEATNIHEFLDILTNNLDPVSLNALGYIVGSFQEIVQLVGLEELPFSNLIWMLRPNALKRPNVPRFINEKELAQFRERRVKIDAFLVEMLDTWDTTPYYP